MRRRGGGTRESTQEGTACKSVERTKKFEETDKLKYNISNWIWEVVQIWRQEALSWFSTAAAKWFLYDSILAVEGNNNSFVYGKKKTKKKFFGVQRHRNCSHAETVGCCSTDV